MDDDQEEKPAPLEDNKGQAEKIVIARWQVELQVTAFARVDPQVTHMIGLRIQQNMNKMLETREIFLPPGYQLVMKV